MLLVGIPPNRKCFNMLASTFAYCGKRSLVVHLVTQIMKNHFRVSPDSSTLQSVLRGCIVSGDAELGSHIYAFLNVSPSVDSIRILLQLYASSGSVELGFNLIERARSLGLALNFNPYTLLMEGCGLVFFQIVLSSSHSYPSFLSIQFIERKKRGKEKSRK